MPCKTGNTISICLLRVGLVGFAQKRFKILISMASLGQFLLPFLLDGHDMSCKPLCSFACSLIRGLLSTVAIRKLIFVCSVFEMFFFFASKGLKLNRGFNFTKLNEHFRHSSILYTS